MIFVAIDRDRVLHAMCVDSNDKDSEQFVMRMLRRGLLVERLTKEEYRGTDWVLVKADV